MPSANPDGRPKKGKRSRPSSLQQVVTRALARDVKMIEGTREKTATQLEAMVEVILNDFPRAKLAEKMRLLCLLREFAPEIELTRPPEVCPDAIVAFVARLAQEAEHLEGRL